MLNLVLVGLGPCARSNYFPLLEQLSLDGHLRLRLLIEVEGREAATDDFLAARTLRPMETLYVSRDARDAQRLPPPVRRVLDALRERGELDGILIATEPKAHLAYLEWAIQSGVRTLVEKPVLALEGIANDAAVAERLVSELRRLLELQERTGSKVTVMAQRRYHRGYEFIAGYLREFLQRFGVPVSLIEVFHSDGQWNMPAEFRSRENHPYRYGYGKLLHGGYHFVDLFLWLQRLNETELGVVSDAASIFTETFDVHDALAQVGPDRYRRLMGAGVAWPDDTELAAMYELGELDCYNTIRMRAGARTVTTGLVHVVSNSFSRRAWSELPADDYKQNGRVKHERLHLAVGPLLNVQVHSYESYETAKGVPAGAPPRGTVGGADHFDVLLFRNAALCGGPAFERHSFGETAEGDVSLIQSARDACIREFLAGTPSRSPLADHERTNELIAAMYGNIARGRAGAVPLTQVELAARRGEKAA